MWLRKLVIYIYSHSNFTNYHFVWWCITLSKIKLMAIDSNDRLITEPQLSMHEIICYLKTNESYAIMSNIVNHINRIFSWVCPLSHDWFMSHNESCYQNHKLKFESVYHARWFQHISTFWYHWLQAKERTGGILKSQHGLPWYFTNHVLKFFKHMLLIVQILLNQTS